MLLIMGDLLSTVRTSSGDRKWRHFYETNAASGRTALVA
jgi:hypothetical protein